MKNAIITAATKGMGRAIAIAFAKEGVNLAICARTNDDLLAFKKNCWLSIQPLKYLFRLLIAALNNNYCNLQPMPKRSWVLSASS